MREEKFEAEAVAAGVGVCDGCSAAFVEEVAFLGGFEGKGGERRGSSEGVGVVEGIGVQLDCLVGRSAERKYSWRIGGGMEMRNVMLLLPVSVTDPLMGIVVVLYELDAADCLSIAFVIKAQARRLVGEMGSSSAS